MAPWSPDSSSEAEICWTARVDGDQHWPRRANQTDELSPSGTSQNRSEFDLSMRKQEKEQNTSR